MYFKFEVIETDRDSLARTGRLITPSGIVDTPAFMPVATQGTVKAVSPRDLHNIGCQIIVTNTYHLHLRPGEKIIEKAGGIHKFMGWDGTVLIDSGGFQVHSLSDLRNVSDEGVEFRSHIDGKSVVFTPKKVIDIERKIGADIVMVLDQPSGYPVSFEEARRDLELTNKWARVAKEYWDILKSEQAIFGIIQGSVYPELRERGAREITSFNFDGYAIGGLALGEPKVERDEVLKSSLFLLPEDKPRYVMGIGFPEDIISAIVMGADLFDCVLPTRNARTGTVFTRKGKLVIKNSNFKEDFSPIDENCRCYTCSNFTRAYIRHLFHAGEILAPYLATIHSLTFFTNLMQEIRSAINEGKFSEWRRNFLREHKSNQED